MKNLIPVLVMAGLVVGCSNDSRWNRQTAGGTIGAITGGWFGSQFGSGEGTVAMAAAGAVLGALAGSHLALSAEDQRSMNYAASQAQTAPIGETITWNNPQTGAHGSYTAVRDGYTQSGLYCREFTQNITVGGETQVGYGTACQQPDGAWKIVGER